MSSSDPQYNATALAPQPDYRIPIARAGEQQFAAIIRNRSGMDSGNIDYDARDITCLSTVDQQDAVDSAYMLYETFRDQTGLRARRDVTGGA